MPHHFTEFAVFRAPPIMSEKHSPLSILHVVDTLETGGLERVVTDLAIAQHQAGHSVAVFSINDTAGFRDELRSAGVEVVIGDKRGTLDRSTLRILRKAIKSRGVRIVHTHNFVPNYYAVLASMGLRGVRLVNTCHNMGTRLSQRRLRWLYRLSILGTSRVAMVSDQVLQRLVESGIAPRERAVTVLNGIPLQRFEHDAGHRVRARAQLGIADSALVIACVGRLVAVKNHQWLIEQLPQLVREFPDLQLVLVGNGALEQALREKVAALGLSDHVLFAGTQSNVADLMPAFDVFAMPSLSEGMSIALLEASASALAIVATKVGGNAQIIKHGERGLLVESGNSPQLIDALRRVLGDAALRMQLGEAARSWVQSNASIDVMRRNYDVLYRDVLHLAN
jgi:glycosyltransferase involved in cell wall biosynthesis